MFLKRYFFSILSTFILLNTGCQYALNDIKQPEKTKFLVITAELTETYGRVSVEYSSETIVDSRPKDKIPTLQGTAYVIDSKGKKTSFALDGLKNNDFKGEVGETYQLFIETEGKKYKSLVETMLPCPKIDSLAATFSENLNLRPGFDKLYYGYDVVVHSKDLPEKGNFYQWSWAHYQRKPFCGLKQDLRAWRQPIKSLPCLEDCFTIDYNPDFIILSDELSNGQNFKRLITRVPYIVPPTKYYLEVEQRAITKHAHEYYNAVVASTQNNGTQYDIAPQTLFSPNISCETDPNEKVLGVFNVFSSHQKIIIIDKSIKIDPKAAPYVEPPLYETYILALFEVIDPYPDCGPETRFNTTKKPVKWED